MEDLQSKIMDLNEEKSSLYSRIEDIDGEIERIQFELDGWYYGRAKKVLDWYNRDKFQDVLWQQDSIDVKYTLIDQFEYLLKNVEYDSNKLKSLIHSFSTCYYITVKDYVPTPEDGDWFNGYDQYDFTIKNKKKQKYFYQAILDFFSEIDKKEGF